MKKIYLLFQLLLVLFAIQVNAGIGDFVTIWDLTKTGSGANQITFYATVNSTGTSYSWETVPAESSGGPVAITTSNHGAITITGLPADKKIKLTIVSTNLKSFRIDPDGSSRDVGPDRARLVEVSNWGSAVWNTMSSAFYNCNNLTVTATDVPDLTSVATMNNMFRGCSALTTVPDMGTWATSGVTNMDAMFRSATLFNQDIGDWITTNVGSMQYMFRAATTFNQDIGQWDVAGVSDMTGMFRDASAFNQNLGAWIFNSGVNITEMFNASGMDCAHYSATLMGWAENPDLPIERSLGATGMTYGTNAVDARNTLDVTRQWTISGDASSGSTCILASFPVTLISFSAREAEGGAALRWETTSEVGASHFEIERSADARNFKKIGRVEALGNSNKLHVYTFADNLSAYGGSVVYYRLRSVDLDESFSLSRVIALQRKKEFVSLGIYPNPVTQAGKVTLETNAPQVHVRLLDLLGRQAIFSTIQTKNGKAELDLAGVKSGLYIIQLNSGGGLASGKLVVN